MNYNKTKVLAIVLCRTGSKRLKNKLLLNFGKKKVIEFFFERLKKTKGIDKIVVATTNKTKDKALIQSAKKYKLDYFIGNEKNVLERFYFCAKKYSKKYNIIVRANADCPCFMPSILTKDINNFKKGKYDLYTPFYKNKIPFGFSFVIFKNKTIKKIFEEAHAKKYKEHIENYCFENKDKFKILLSDYHKNYNCKNLSLTLDTKKDYKKLLKVQSLLEAKSIINQPNYLINLYNRKLFF